MECIMLRLFKMNELSPFWQFQLKNADFIAELLYWIAVECTSVPNKVVSECIIYIVGLYMSCSSSFLQSLKILISLDTNITAVATRNV